jgi:hypothetical protein
VLPGDDEQVHGGQGVDIAEDDNILVLIKEFRGYLPGDYLAENAVGIFINLPYPLNSPSPIKERGRD